MLSGSGRPHRSLRSITKLPGDGMDYPEDENEGNLFIPEPAEILACLANEAVVLIEEGENAETVIYSALESAYNYGRITAGGSPEASE